MTDSTCRQVWLVKLALRFGLGNEGGNKLQRQLRKRIPSRKGEKMGETAGAGQGQGRGRAEQGRSGQNRYFKK